MIFYAEQCGVAVRKSTWNILWPADIEVMNGCRKCAGHIQQLAEGDNSLEW